MEEKDCISVIVPVFNVKTYLRQCIDSIISQTYSNLEIIIVNDGSTDGSKDICEEYRKQDERIKVIHQENSGLSLARNSGLDVATGEYISFVDSDDYIERDMLETMIKAIYKYGADLASYSFISLSEETYDEINSLDGLKGISVINGKQMMNLVSIRGKRYAHYAVWARLYSRDIIKDIRFVPGLRGCEDIPFTAEVLTHVKRCVCSDIPVYNYRIIKGSLSHSNRVFFPDYLIAHNKEIEIINNMGWDEIAINLRIEFYQNLLFYYSKSREKNKKRMIRNNLKKNKTSSIAIVSLNRSILRKIRLILEMNIPYIFVFYYSIRFMNEEIKIEW